MLAGISLTVLAEWIAVFIRDNRAQWNDATWLQIGLLAVMSVADLIAIREVRRVGLPGDADRLSPASPDWITDAFLLARKHSQMLGPVQRPALTLLRWSDHSLAGKARRHPLWTALGGCAGFGAAVGINQGVREGYLPAVTVVACILLAAGMFGLLAASGYYLGLIRASTPLRGNRRRLADAAVITSGGILVPFAMRNHLWWMVGSNPDAADLAQLLQLLAIFATAIFAVTYLSETLLRLHREPLRQDR
jgi:hypothetical protein